MFLSRVSFTATVYQWSAWAYQSTCPRNPTSTHLAGKGKHRLCLLGISFYSCVTCLTVLVISVKKCIAIDFLVSGSICVAWKDGHLQGIKSLVLCSRSISLEMRQWRQSVLRLLFFTQNKERTELLGRISLFCWMGSSICTTLVEVTSHLTIQHVKLVFDHCSLCLLLCQ